MKFEANPHVSNCPVCGSRDLRKIGTDSNSCRACGSVITDRGMLSWGERRLEQRRNQIPHQEIPFQQGYIATGSVDFLVPAPIADSSQTGFSRLETK